MADIFQIGLRKIFEIYKVFLQIFALPNEEISPLNIPAFIKQGRNNLQKKRRHGALPCRLVDRSHA